MPEIKRFSLRSTSHTRVTSSRAMRHHAAAGPSLRVETRRRSLSEPSYTAYVYDTLPHTPTQTCNTHRQLHTLYYASGLPLPSRGTPRQDIPHPVFSDAAMYDDVFDKEGRLLSGRNTAKFSSPLHTVRYNR